MTNSQPEPSMEDILASIRQIISEDDDDASNADALDGRVTTAPTNPTALDLAPVSVGEPVQDAPDHAIEGDAIEGDAIGDEAIEDRAIEEEAVAPQSVRSVHDAIFTMSSDIATRPAAPEPSLTPTLGEVARIAPSADAAPVGETPSSEDLSEREPPMLAESTTAAASKAFQSLSETVRPAVSDARTVEQIVVDMLNPMIKEWLDANLPTIVEEKVEEEVRRVARRAR